MINSVVNSLTSIFCFSVLLFDPAQFWLGFETEFVVACIFILIGTQWRYYSDYRSFYSRSNRFEDYYEMRQHFLENRKIFDMNDKTLANLEEMLTNVIKKVDDIERNQKINENPNRFYETVNKILDRLDRMEKKDKVIETKKTENNQENDNKHK